MSHPFAAHMSFVRRRPSSPPLFAAGRASGRGSGNRHGPSEAKSAARQVTQGEGPNQHLDEFLERAVRDRMRRRVEAPVDVTPTIQISKTWRNSGEALAILRRFLNQPVAEIVQCGEPPP